MKRLALLMLCLAQPLTPAHAAEDAPEMLVATSLTDKTVIPGASLRRPADYLLQRIRVSSDSPDADVRRDEIMQTLRLLQNAAARGEGLELSVLPYARLVAPLKVDPSSLRLSAGSRAQTSEIVIAVKTKVDPMSSDPDSLYSRLRAFPAGVRPVGRSAIDLMGDIELTIVNPEQYRGQVIQRYADDARSVTSALGAEYRVVTRGIDRQLQWIRDGRMEVLLYIPYEYDVIPVNVSSYSH